MGEMCDFEAKYYPHLWDPWYQSRQSKGRRKPKTYRVTMTLNAKQHEKLKAIGGLVALKRLLDAQ